MFSSVPLMSLFTVVFVATAIYSVARLAALASGVSAGLVRGVDRATELSHVLMSVAMIAMARGWSGGPSSPSGVLQIVAFGLVGLYFLVDFLGGAVRGHRARVAGTYHLVMALAMVWMVAATPLLMEGGAPRAGSRRSAATAMEGMPWMSSGRPGYTGPAAAVSAGMAGMLAAML